MRSTLSSLHALAATVLTTLAASAHAAVGAAKPAAPAVAAAVPVASPASAGNLLQVLLGLIVVLALMAALAWVLRRFNAGKMTGNADIRVVAGVNVGTRERVVVVEVGEQWIVVGVAPGRVNALATMHKQEASLVNDPVPSKNFSSWLAQTLDKKSNG